MIHFKPIKPGVLRDARIRARVKKAMQEMGPEIQEDFEKTTATWEHEPKFHIKLTDFSDGLSLEVYTQDQIYAWVNDGTRPYRIYPKNAWMLVFPGTFRPKTTPRVIGSGPGYSGGDLQFRPYVYHPGIESRDFDLEIEDIWKPKMKPRLEKAMKLAAKECGHGG